MRSTEMYRCHSMGNALGKPRVHQNMPRITNVISRFSYLNTIVCTPCTGAGPAETNRERGDNIQVLRYMYIRMILQYSRN